MKKILHYFFPALKKTVDGVMANYQKTMEDLNKVSAESRAAADKHLEKAARLGTKANQALREASRAEQISSKMAALLA